MTQQRTATTATTEHVHDFSVSISAGDVPEDLMPYLAAELLAKTQAIIDDWMKDPLNALDATATRLAQIDLHAEVDYDGRRDCDLPHTQPRQPDADPNA